MVSTFLLSLGGELFISTYWILEILWENPTEYWKPWGQCVQRSGEIWEKPPKSEELLGPFSSVSPYVFICCERRKIHKKKLPGKTENRCSYCPPCLRNDKAAFWIKFWKWNAFMFTRIKNRKCNRNFKISQRFFSYFCSFQPYHLKQKSNWCDSPFRGARSHPWVNYSIILYYPRPNRTWNLS